MMKYSYYPLILFVSAYIEKDFLVEAWLKGAPSEHKLKKNTSLENGEISIFKPYPNSILLLLI